VDKLVNSLGHDFEGTGKANGCNGRFSGFDFSQWHTVTCIFDFDRISFLVDDVPVRIIHRIISSSGEPVNCGDKIAQGVYYQLKAYPIEKMNIIFNLALISKNGPGGSVPVDESTPFPSAFEVDYVRMWRKDTGDVQLSAFPVPATNTLTLSSNQDMKLVELWDMYGRIVFSGEVFSREVPVDISTMNEGIYTARCKFQNGYKSVRIIKTLK
jgi:hypothetical protein